MKIKVYNDNGRVEVVKVTENGTELTMFSNVGNGEVAIIEVQSSISIKGELDSISRYNRYLKGGMQMDLNNISKYMSLILRHKPEVIGIELDEHGWANVDDLISGIKKDNHEFDLELLEKIVKTDNKQRYSFNDEKTLIRANQGHSIPVDVELEEKRPPEFLYHGTGEKYVESIDKIGLIPKSRLYVHLSKDIITAEQVGKRHGKEIVYQVDAGQMYKDGYKFFLSVNNVWLTKEVPMKYLER